jgi:hypothetical protein
MLLQVDLSSGNHTEEIKGSHDKREVWGEAWNAGHFPACAVTAP